MWRPGECEHVGGGNAGGRSDGGGESGDGPADECHTGTSGPASPTVRGCVRLRPIYPAQTHMSSHREARATTVTGVARAIAPAAAPRRGGSSRAEPPRTSHPPAQLPPGRAAARPPARGPEGPGGWTDEPPRAHPREALRAPADRRTSRRPPTCARPSRPRRVGGSLSPGTGSSAGRGGPRSRRRRCSSPARRTGPPGSPTAPRRARRPWPPACGCCPPSGTGRCWGP